jgi:hypothetical protein
LRANIFEAFSKFKVVDAPLEGIKLGKVTTTLISFLAAFGKLAVIPSCQVLSP